MTNSKTAKKVSPVMAGILNFLCPGAGNIYLGQLAKGVVFCALTLALFGADALTCMVFFGASTPLHLIAAVVMTIDAARLADRKNNGETIGDWQFF